MLFEKSSSVNENERGSSKDSRPKNNFTVKLEAPAPAKFASITEK